MMYLITGSQNIGFFLQDIGVMWFTFLPDVASEIFKSMQLKKAGHEVTLILRLKVFFFKKKEKYDKI